MLTSQMNPGGQTLGKFESKIQNFPFQIQILSFIKMQLKIPCGEVVLQRQQMRSVLPQNSLLISIFLQKLDKMIEILKEKMSFSGPVSWLDISWLWHAVILTFIDFLDLVVLAGVGWESEQNEPCWFGGKWASPENWSRWGEIERRKQYKQVRKYIIEKYLGNFKKHSELRFHENVNCLI